MALCKVDCKLPMATYGVSPDLAVTKGSSMWPMHVWVADIDPDRGAAVGPLTNGPVDLPLKAMTSNKTKTGTLRPWLSPQLRKLDRGDYIAVVGGRTPVILVQLTAKPVALTFGEVGETRVEKEGLLQKGFGVASGRVCLRRILSLERDSWFQDQESVWWLEWQVVESL